MEHSLPLGRLRLTRWHVMLWLAMGGIAAWMARDICLNYNQIAGTDLTTPHMTRVCLSVYLGPLTGPIANPGANDWPLAWRWAIPLLAIQMATLGPFLISKNPVHPVLAVTAWLAFTGASGLWFFGALLSLGLFLM
jgi:hypothetical protein